MRIAAARDTLSSLPGLGAIKPMPEAEIARAVQLLDLMLDFFAHDGHWTRGSYDDGNGGHCLVSALLHLCRFSDAGGDKSSTRSGSRRLKSAKARNRGKWVTVRAAGSMGI